MKKLTHLWSIGLISLMFLLMLLITSCEGNDVNSMAPSNVTGKTMTIYDEDVDAIYIIYFSSNTSASITYGPAYGGGKLAFSSIQYKKSGYNSALLQISGAYRQGSTNITPSNINISLIFLSPNQGAATGDDRYVSFTLFDGKPQGGDSTTNPEPEPEPEPDPTVEIENNIKNNVQVTFNASGSSFSYVSGGYMYTASNYPFPTRWAIAINITTNLQTIYPSKKITYGYECGYKGYGNGYEYYCARSFTGSDAPSYFSLPSAMLYLPIDGPWSSNDAKYFTDPAHTILTLMSYEAKGTLTSEEKANLNILLTPFEKYESTARNLWQGRVYVQMDGKKYYIKSFKFN